MHFEGLVRRLSPTLKRITYKLNGYHSFFNDEDLFQEALIRLWQDFNSGKLKDKTDSYILQGCYFHLKNYIRKTKVKSNTFSLEALISNEEGVGGRGEFTLKVESTQDLRDSLNIKLLNETILNNGFDPREKRMLYFLKDGLTTREIGRKLGISHVMVVKLIARIREKCQKYTDLN
ncbi:MAG: sigma-70 family RNA polymerase sigma factor [Candidatus Omnitrophica bacterium]|nr:sigma-70 family RNA polymerase sigma factor [Candidatus Omnitrophota bacterium]